MNRRKALASYSPYRIGGRLRQELHRIRPAKLRVSPDTMLWRIRSALKLSPMDSLLRGVSKRGVTLGELHVLEVFGYTGEHHTQCYFSRVASLEIWEILPECEEKLRNNLPGAEIKITDSFIEVQSTHGKFDLIFCDNPITSFGEHCEHFDLLPHLFRVVEDSVVIVLNVVLDTNRAATRYHFIDGFGSDEHIRQRARFYDTDTPEAVSYERMVATYERISKIHGFEIEWTFLQRRDRFIHYLTLKLRRVKD